MAFDVNVPGPTGPSELDIVAAGEPYARKPPLLLDDALTSAEPSPELISALVSRFRGSEEYAEMVEGREYFSNRTKIDSKVRTIMDPDSGVTEYPDGVVSNAKIKHPDFRTMVRQKISYLFSKPFSIECADEGLQKVLERYFDDRVRATLKEGTKRAVYYGRSPFEVYYGADGIMRVRTHHATEVIPYWEDDEHTRLIAALRFYEVDVVNPDASISRERRYDFYNRFGVYHFVAGRDGRPVRDTARGQGGWEPNYYDVRPKRDADGNAMKEIDPATGKPVTVTETVGMNYSTLPMLFLRYNDEEYSLIRDVKPLIDEYDETCSNVSDELRDVPNSIKVIRGYNGENLGELVHNIRLFRAVSVQSDGGVENVDSKIDSTAVENHLTRVRKDMYSAGSCVDTTRVDNLGNQSGVAMRYIYSDLDMTSMETWDSLENQVLKPLARFFLHDHYLKTGESFSDLTMDFIPNTDISVNETETISNLKNSVGLISQETIIANHPYVTDARKELERVKKEQEEQAEMLAADGLSAMGGSAKQPKEITSRANGAKSVE